MRGGLLLQTHVVSYTDQHICNTPPVILVFSRCMIGGTKSPLGWHRPVMDAGQSASTSLSRCDYAIHGLLASGLYFCVLLLASILVVQDEIAFHIALSRYPHTSFSAAMIQSPLRPSHSQMNLLRGGVRQYSAVSRGPSRLHSIANSLRTRV